MICFLFEVFGFYVKKICVEFKIDNFDITLIFSHYLKWSYFSKLYFDLQTLPKKGYGHYFFFIGIHQLNLNIRSIKYENIEFTFLYKMIKKPFFLNFCILMKDKNQRHFNPHFNYQDFKKKIKMCSKHLF